MSKLLCLIWVVALVVLPYAVIRLLLGNWSLNNYCKAIQILYNLATSRATGIFLVVAAILFFLLGGLLYGN